ncbi:MAG: glycosyltransferase family 4 protein [Actinomycetota bacterium]|nr:glycosyltransferase family 4 protein [Actinomycetota bacterium]MCL6094102.1 glycosyltransferase family 4 protein [Actinomycetota bacterium]MDA8166991.1 glycosyltransferase family 4 protein [Actinomycetota bacterium]
MSTPENANKIWIVVFAGNNGLTHYSYCLAQALAAAGSNVVLVTNRNYDLEDFPAGFPIVKVFSRTRRYPIDVIRYWRLFLRERPAVVHYQYFLKFPAVEAILLNLQRRTGARLIFTAHDWLPHNPRFYHAALFRRIYRLFDRIIVHSPSGFRFLASELGVDPRKLDVIPHGHYGFFGTDSKLTAAVARERLGLDPDRFWFLFFGRIDPHKGLDAALRALAVTGAGDDGGPKPPGLIVAGDPGPHSLEPYRKLIGELGLEDRVSMHAGHVPVPEIQVYFRAADAVVLPYRESSTSGIAHVAMGFAKPVVATAVGGLVDVIEDGVTGLLVPAGDDQQLAAAMERIAGEAETRARLAAGWDSVREHYSWQAIARQTQEVYARVAGGN